VILEVEIDKHPANPYWNKPEGLAGAFHALAALPEDALPDDRVTVVAASPTSVNRGSLMASIAREAGGLTDDKAEALRALRHGADAGGPATLDDVRQLELEVGNPAKVDTWLDHPLEWADGRAPPTVRRRGAWRCGAQVPPSDRVGLEQLTHVAVQAHETPQRSDKRGFVVAILEGIGSGRLDLRHRARRRAPDRWRAAAGRLPLGVHARNPGEPVWG
jgi:hypothetical protein